MIYRQIVLVATRRGFMASLAAGFSAWILIPVLAIMAGLLRAWLPNSPMLQTLIFSLCILALFYLFWIIKLPNQLGLLKECLLSPFTLILFTLLCMLAFLLVYPERDDEDLDDVLSMLFYLFWAACFFTLVVGGSTGAILGLMNGLLLMGLHYLSPKNCYRWFRVAAPLFTAIVTILFFYSEMSASDRYQGELTIFAVTCFVVYVAMWCSWDIQQAIESSLESPTPSNLENS